MTSYVTLIYIEVVIAPKCSEIWNFLYSALCQLLRWTKKGWRLCDSAISTWTKPKLLCNGGTAVSRSRENHSDPVSHRRENKWALGHYEPMGCCTSQATLNYTQSTRTTNDLRALWTHGFCTAHVSWHGNVPVTFRPFQIKQTILPCFSTLLTVYYACSN